MESAKLEEEEFSREKAKEYRKKGENQKAEIILEKLWNDSNKANVYLLYDYGIILRNNSKSDKFIEICREYARNEIIIKNTYIISLLCWCIYDVYIRDFEKTEETDFEEFLKEAKFIKNNCKQLSTEKEYYNPYVLTVFKVIRVYLKSASVNYKEVLKWLEALNPNELSEKVYNFQDSDGQDREMASKKEFYYQYKTKALEKLQKYEECIKVCEEAFNSIEQFHYRNHIWIKTRLYFSKCMEVDSESVEDEISKYKELAYKENHWFMYHKLSLICWRYGKMEDALLYANKALTCKFEYEKMNKLLQDVALLWEHKGNIINAKIYYEASVYYRNRNGWKMTEELEFAISKYNLNINNRPNVNLIQKISAEYVIQIEGEDEYAIGKIIKINWDYGFINVRGQKDNVYFKVKDALNSNSLGVGNIVEFKVIKTDKGNRALNIRNRGNKNGRNMYK